MLTKIGYYRFTVSSFEFTGYSLEFRVLINGEMNLVSIFIWI